MKKLCIFSIVLFCIVSFVGSAGAKNRYGCFALTGGTSGALDAIDITATSAPNASNLADGDSAIVAIISGTTSTVYEYVFDADGTSAESSPTVIRPDDYATAGVWRLCIINNNALDATLAAFAALTIQDASVVQGTGADAFSVLASGGNNYILGSTSDNSALEFKTPANVLTQIGGLGSAATDNIKDTHIDWGSGASQVDLDDVPDGSSYQRVAASDVDASGHVSLVQDSDGTGAFTFTGSSATRAITVPTDAAFTIVDLTTSQTLTTKTIDADDNTLQDVPHDLNISLIPNDSYDNLMVKRFQRAVTFSAIGCMVDPADSGETVVLDIYECDSNGDNCAESVTQVTCANTPTAAAVNDGAFDANDFMKITIGTVTGTVSSLIIYGTGKESW